MGGLLAATAMDRAISIGPAALAAMAAIVAAVLSAKAANRSKLAELESVRIAGLENRLAERKYDTYEPMIELLRRMLEGRNDGFDDEDLQSLHRFAAWITVFGGDEAVIAYHNFMQATFHDPPPEVLLRLYAEFVLAARRDLADSESGTTVAQVLGIRIKDLYDERKYLEMASLSLAELAAKHGWAIPWESKLRP